MGAECSNAETGVGPAMALGSQKYNGPWALLRGGDHQEARDEAWLSSAPLFAALARSSKLVDVCGQGHDGQQQCRITDGIRSQCFGAR